jgi:hypothetical protein
MKLARLKPGTTPVVEAEKSVVEAEKSVVVSGFSRTM